MSTKRFTDILAQIEAEDTARVAAERAMERARYGACCECGRTLSPSVLSKRYCTLCILQQSQLFTSKDTP